MYGNEFVDLVMINKGNSKSPERLVGIVSELGKGSVLRHIDMKLSDLPHNLTAAQLLEVAEKL